MGWKRQNDETFYYSLHFQESKSNDSRLRADVWQIRLGAQTRWSTAVAVSFHLLILSALVAMATADVAPSDKNSDSTFERNSALAKKIFKREASSETEKGFSPPLQHISELGRHDRMVPSLLTNLGGEKSRKIRNANELSFGRRPFGPLERFEKPPKTDQKWVAYFFEESLAVVLQTSKNLMLDCTVIELRTDEEQQAALQTFGLLMELAPLPLADMIHLMKLCGELPLNKVHPSEDNQLGRSINSSDGNQGQNSNLILPGTLWCGVKDRAPTYAHLGERTELDMCCRTHDHCPLKVESTEERYGVYNFGIGAKSHCLCEEEFYRCLKTNTDNMADMVGNLYFGIIRPQCLHGVPFNPKLSQQVNPIIKVSTRPSETLYKCVVWFKKECRFWIKRKVDYALSLQSFNLQY